MSNIKHICHFIEEYLQKFEKSLKKEFLLDDILINKIANHILFSGGKRLRPSLVFLFASFDKVKEEHYLLAEAVELIHNATLLHDDIVDSSNIRHSQKTAHLVWDTKTAILAGDFLLSLALDKLQIIANPRILSIFTKSLQEICKGEIEEFSIPEKINLDCYLNRIYRKTAILFAISCESALILSNFSEDFISNGFEYGKNLGMAFQIFDDILPYISSSLNKPCEIDFENKIDTLPTILARQAKLPIERCNTFDEQKKIIKNSNILDKSVEFALEYTRNSQKSLEIFEDCQSKEVLSCLLDTVLDKEAL